MSNNIFDLEKEKEKEINKHLEHKCDTCNNMCKRKNCRDCYNKFIEDKQGECCDCKKLFLATRFDGTKRKRCLECQNIYNNKHIAKCPLCSKDYHANLDDGRYFDKCYECYQNTLKKCDNCNKKTQANQALCRECYSSERNTTLLSYSPTSSTSAELTFKQFTKICKNEGCNNLTNFTYCKLCYDNYKGNIDLTECAKCGWKFKGSFELCKKCFLI
jgi:hypothetical protein